MNGEYVFHVRGGQAKPYRTGFRTSNSTVKSTCTCPSGLNSLREGMLCKHRLALLTRDFSAVRTPANIESFNEWARARGSAVIEAVETRSAPSKRRSVAFDASSVPRSRDIGLSTAQSRAESWIVAACFHADHLFLAQESRDSPFRPCWQRRATKRTR